MYVLYPVHTASVAFHPALIVVSGSIVPASKVAPVPYSIATGSEGLNSQASAMFSRWYVVSVIGLEDSVGHVFRSCFMP